MSRTLTSRRIVLYGRCCLAKQGTAVEGLLQESLDPSCIILGGCQHRQLSLGSACRGPTMLLRMIVEGRWYNGPATAHVAALNPGVQNLAKQSEARIALERITPDRTGIYVCSLPTELHL